MSRPVPRFAAAAAVGFLVSLFVSTYVVVAITAGLGSAVVLGEFAGRVWRWSAIFAALRTIADRTKLVSRMQADLTSSAAGKVRAITEKGTAVRTRLRVEGIASPLLERRLEELVETSLAELTTLTQEAAGMLHQAMMARADRSG